MKKFTLIITTFLVLITSIVFSGCKNKYDKIEIKCNREIVELTIQEEADDRSGVIFEISGVKSWGKVDVDSKPSGAISVEEIETDGKKCYVILRGVQPTDGEAELVITHLASGKQGSVPLTVGLKLQDVTSKGNNLVVDIPEKIEVEGELQDVEKEYSISIGQLINTVPLNYSDKIIWTTDDVVEGVTLKQYLANGGEAGAEKVFTPNNEQNNIDPKHIEGISEVVKTAIVISSECVSGSSIKLIPISVFNGSAVKYSDVEVNVKFIQVLNDSLVAIKSSTHGIGDGVVEDLSDDNNLSRLVLISNPSEKRYVEDSYNYYNTANIEFEVQDAEIYKDLYDIEVESEIDYLLIEELEWNKFRIIASEDSYGAGKIVVKFVPNNSVGDLQSFEMSFDCVVGEQATSINGYRGRAKIDFAYDEKENVIKGKTSLTDDYSTSDGQRFKFEVLSTNTLDALSYYQIIIEPELLYINPSHIKTETIEGVTIKYSPYIQNQDKTQFNLNDYTQYTQDKYKYLISMKKDGRDIVFYYNDTDKVFESELLKGNNIDTKYVVNDSGENLNPDFFGIKIRSSYDKRYDLTDNKKAGIYQNGFDNLSIEYQLEFTRQRKVESVNYTPIQITNIGSGWVKSLGEVEDDDWKFYFNEAMLRDGYNYYGIKIDEIKGINNSNLTNAELEDITLTLQIQSKQGQDCNIGVVKYNIDNNYTFGKELKYVFNSQLSDNNIILIGAVSGSKIDFGEYYLEFVQDGIEIQAGNKNSNRDINVYKQITEDDIALSIPNADFEGDKYLDIVYQLIQTEEKFNLINYTERYKFDGEQYIECTKDDSWAENTYYIKNLTYILANQSEYDLRVEIKDKDYANFYEVLGQTSKINNNFVELQTLTYVYNNLKISTPVKGLFNITTGTKDYIKLIITTKVDKYNYFAVNSIDTYEVSKELYFYVYEPINTIGFDIPSIDRFDYSVVENTIFEDYSKQTLNIKINDLINNDNIKNYISSIDWTTEGDGIDDERVFISENKLSAEYSFEINDTNANIITGFKISATIKQFGSSYTIDCPYIVRKPILTEQILFKNSVSYFQSGTAFINLKDGQGIKIDAENYSSKGQVSLPGFNYYVCNQYGYSTDVVNVDNQGNLTSLKAGKAKLIIVSQDSLKTSYSSGDLITWIENNVVNGCYLIIDILITDGTTSNPHLISTVEDLQNINNSNKCYVLINNINLSGPITIDEFSGSLTSYQENVMSKSRFCIYGVTLTKSNPNLITRLTGTGTIEDIDIYVNMNYSSLDLIDKQPAYVGVIGTNKGVIKNITINVLGEIAVATDDTKVAPYYVGVMVANNEGDIIIDNQTLVGVQGQLNINAQNVKELYLGGIAGRNIGQIIGAVDELSETAGTDVEYGVFYDNQGAMSSLEVVAVGNPRTSSTVGIGLVVGFNDVEEIEKDGEPSDFNIGTLKNVYSTGYINAPTITGIGGLIGKNKGKKLSGITVTTNEDTYSDLLTITMPNTGYQITNSYSTATLYGNNNVGGIVGFDENGSYKKVYYEIYDNATAIKGDGDNIGGLIGYSQYSDLYYCYVNSFVWGFANTVDYYEIVGNNYVGGLIGYSNNIDNKNFANAKGTHIVNSACSATLTAKYNVAGLIGKFKLFGGIYNSYFHGLIENYNLSMRRTYIANVYSNDSEEINDSNIPYNNTYSVVNGLKRADQGNITQSSNTLTGTPFVKDNDDTKYNNGYPYIQYNGKNLITIVPNSINIANAIVEKVPNGTAGAYVLQGNTYVLNTESLTSNTYNITAIYEQNKNGEYVRISGKWEVYNANNHSGYTRYTLRTIPINTGITDDESNVYNNIIVAYYYQFSSMAEEYANIDMRELNTLDMHEVLNDSKITVNPIAVKRFSLISSDSSVVSVLANGKLLLKKEGKVTITLVSALNPNATASFVIIVRSKVLNFGLYSNANYLKQYLINNQTLSIVKNQSKIIYADYSGVIEYFNRVYNYNSATNMNIEFTITATGLAEGDTVDKYITFNNGTKLSAGRYLIKYGSPITISVHEYFYGEFKIQAKPYVVVNFDNDINVQLADKYNQTFTVITRKGVSSVNPDKTRIEMMPMDDAEVDIQISTDYKQETAQIEVVGSNSQGGYELTNNTKYWQMIDIYIDNSKVELTGSSNIGINKEVTFTSNFNNELQLQSFNIKLKLNDKSHYIEHEFTLEVKVSVGGKTGVFNIYVKPQEISTLMVLNYKLDETDTNPADSLDDILMSKIIRPGKRNLIIIDVAPNIAIYDYLEIEDVTYVGNENLANSDSIQFIQLTNDLQAMSDMDEKSAEGFGIKLKKSDRPTSQMYVSAILPLSAQSTNTHTIKITAYDKLGNELKSTTINIEAILYPQVSLEYSYPNGDKADIVRSIDDYNNNKIGEPINLAVGVEAGITVTTTNIDDGSLTYNAKIGVYNSDTNTFEEDETLRSIINVEYQYDKYVLRFDSAKFDEFSGLVGKQILVTFSASKTLNTVVETCSATMVFDIKNMVIHSVSLEHNTSNNTKIYGNYDEQFSIQYYFAPTDISYYNPVTKNYWRTMYTLANTQTGGGALAKIKEILTTLNNDRSSNYIRLVDNFDELIELPYEIKDEDENIKINISQSDKKINIYARSDSNINDLGLNIYFDVSYSDGNPNITLIDDINSATKPIKKYGFNITNKTNPFEDYEEIHNEEEFLAMQEGKHYQLTRDLLFDNYLPLNTNIAALNGNGYTITINKFNVEGLSQIYTDGIAKVGLFGTLNENTVIQNLQVNYPNQTISLEDQKMLNGENYTELYIGGIAGINLGVITNVNIIGDITFDAPQIVPTLIHVGGIAGSNGSNNESSKTKLLATITNSTVSLNISGLGIIGGIADANLGKVSTTIFSGVINCINYSQYEYVGIIYSAGFVVNNYGSIFLSGSSNGDVNSVGSTGGFVAINYANAVIDNCYVSKISISSQGRIGGFVYENNGQIRKCYGYVDIENSMFYAKFISVIGNGTLIDCYVRDNSNEINKINGLTVVNDSEVNKLEKYPNLIFASNNYGVWEMVNSGPELQNIGYTTQSNIINIYDVETFEGFFERCKQDDSGVVVVRDNFRIVRDIDLSSLVTNPTTSQITFQGTFEGNGLTISGYNIYNDITDSSINKITEIGLFAKIKQNASNVFVRNIVLQPTTIRASGINIVGGLAGVIDGAYIYNVKIDNNSMLIVGKNAVGSLAGIIKNELEIIGVSSNVSAFSTYRAGNSSGQYNIYTGRNVLGNDYSDNIQFVSYAGSIAGIINGYTNSSFSASNRNISNYTTISHIEIAGDLTLSAETVGSVAGLVGESTLLENVQYTLSSGTAFKGVFSAGGLVGENRGIIKNTRIFNDSSNQNNNNFNQGARINGGIVGINLGGFVYNAESHVKVYSSQPLSTAGGIVGRNIAGYMHNCIMYGDVDAEFSGGLVGSDYSYDLILNQNRYATPTTSSRIVYTYTLNSGVINYQGVSSSNERYNNNVISKEYLDNFIAKASTYYVFNSNYGNEDNNLIIPKRVYGLFIGLTDNNFGISLELSSKDIKVNLGEENVKTYEVTISGNTYNITAQNLVISGYNTKLLYFVGYQGSSYDYWTTTLGLSNKFVILSSSGLEATVVTE